MWISNFFSQVGTTFSAGIPFVGKGEVSLEVSASYAHTWGKSETQSKTWETSNECVAGAGIKVTCEFFVLKVCMSLWFLV